MSQILFPDPPLTPGQSFNAPNGVTYTWDDTIGTGVWKAAATPPTPPLTITSPGTIAGSPQVGAVLTYTTGTATGGVGAIGYTWQWYITPSTTLGAPNAPTVTVPAGALGKNIYVKLTATDSATPTANTATANTANFPSSGTITNAPFPGTVWGPTPANGLDTIPGLISGPYSGTGTTITATGCIEVSTDGTNFSQSKPITSGQTLYARWIMSSTCGDAATGTSLSGTITDGVYLNNYGPLTVNRKPSPAVTITPSTLVPLGSVVSSSSPSPVTGINTTAYVTLGTGSTGTNIRVSTNGTTWTTLSGVPGASLAITSGQTLYVEQTVGGAISTGYTAVLAIGDSTGVGGASTTYQTVIYTATTVSSAVFPGLTFTPAGGPNAANETVSNVTGGGSLGTLNGVANSNAWPAGLGTTLSSPLSGGVATMKFQKNGAGGFVTSGLGVVPTDILNLAWNVPYLDTVATGSPANGSITGTVGGTTYTNTFTMTVERAASFTTTSGASSGASGTITLVSQVPDQYNVPVKVYQTAPGSNALTSVTVDINSTGPVSLPTSLATALTINPGESVVFSATAPGATATYTTDIHIGDTVHTWSYQVTVTPTVSTPQINNPTSTPAVNPALNSPAGITVTTPTTGNAGGFQTNYGGTQVNSIWDVYKGSYPLTSTNTISGVTQNAAGAWTQQTSSFGTDYISNVTSGGGTYVAVGFNGKLATSSNGTTWVQQTSSFGASDLILGVGYGNGLFVAAGSGKIATSSTGTSWTQQTATGWVATDNMTAVTYGNGLYVVGGSDTGGSNGKITTSPDGIVWTSRTSNFGSNGVQALAYGNSTFVAVGGTNLSTGSCIATSPDGVTWTTRAPGLVSQRLNGVTYGNGLFVTVGGSGFLATSPDGITWTSRTSNFGTTDIKGVGYGAGQFVAVGASGKLATSPDGITWTLQTSSFSTSGINAVTYGLSGFVAVGSSGTLATSSAPSTTLTITNCQTEGFLVGDTVVSGSGAAAGPATILSLDNTQVTVTSSTGWVGTNTQTVKRDPASYTAVTGFPLTKTTAPLNEAFIPQANLAVSSKYYASVTFTGSGTPNVVSSPSAWSEFNTTASFAITPGTAMAGGYFGGQILDGTTIYNLIVAPVGPVTQGANTLYGQYGGLTATQGLQYKTSAGADTNPPAQNEVNGALATASFGSSGAHPLFAWPYSDSSGPNAGTYDATNSAGTGIGGYNDWYIPAKNELAILYYFLKPDATLNTTLPASGSNANAVLPYAANTSYTSGTPGITSSTLFQSAGGAQAFYMGGGQYYWTSSEVSGTPTSAWGQRFTDGNQQTLTKTSVSNYARAIRRVAA